MVSAGVNPQDGFLELQSRLARARSVAERARMLEEETTARHVDRWVDTIMTRIEEAAARGERTMQFSRWYTHTETTCWGLCSRSIHAGIPLHVMGKIRRRLEGIGLVVTPFEGTLYIRWLSEPES